MLGAVGELTSHFVEGPRACDYLAARLAALEYRVMTGVSADELQAMLERGWRRNERGDFSKEYFTPVDLVALYWHLVDLVWIYLFPLLYLI